MTNSSPADAEKISSAIEDLKKNNPEKYLELLKIFNKTIENISTELENAVRPSK